jgi:O-antigen/teichoic acid export membrane protein
MGGRVRKVWDDARRTLAAVLRTAPHDVSTAEGRSKERYRRAALSTVTSAVAQGLGIFTGLASIRITIGYLGKEQYGLWMAVSALLTWAALADFGLGRGVQNHLSEAYGLDDRDAAARFVSTGFVVLSAIALVFTVVMAPLVLVVPWGRVLNVQDPALAGRARIVVAAVAAVFLCNFPLSLVPTIYRAHQRAYVANLFAIVGNLLSLVALLLIVELKLPMPWLIMTAGGIGVLMTLVNLAWILRDMPWLRPRWSLATRGTLRALAGVSIPMLLYQLGGLVINETQTLLIAHRVGLGGVTDYAVLMRVYALPALLVSMIDGPLIPAFREAYVRGDRAWLRAAFWRLTKLKMWLAAGAAVGYLLLGNFAVRLLSGRAVSFDWRVWAACGFLQIVAIWNVSFNDLLIAINRLWVLVIGILFNGLVTLSLTWWLSKPLGILGVVLATPVYSLVVTAWLFPWFSRDVVGDPPSRAAPPTQEATR